MRCLLMRRDAEVLEFVYDPVESRAEAIVEAKDLDAAPLRVWNARIAATGGRESLLPALNRWWRERRVPASRLGIGRVADDEALAALAFASRGLSLSDQYWVKPKGLGLAWRDVNFYENPFDERTGRLLAGMRAAPDEEGLTSPWPGDPTPSSTVGGVLPKMWRIGEGGARVLMKSGSGALMQEPFNELAATRACELLLGPGEYVSYALEQADGLWYSCCACMAGESVELVSARDIHAASLRADGSMTYDSMLEAAREVGVEGMEARLCRTMVLDYLLANVDRHPGNFGALHELDGDRWVPAPVFDTGLSLLCKGGERAQDVTAQACQPFLARFHQQLALVGDFGWLDAGALAAAPDAVAGAVSRCPSRYMDEERVDYLRAYVSATADVVARAADLGPCPRDWDSVSERAEVYRRLLIEGLAKRGKGAVLDPSPRPAATIGPDGPGEGKAKMPRQGAGSPRR